MNTTQYSLFHSEQQQPKDASQQEWGTFKDSLRAPIHNWFTYPAGFSYKAVEASLKSHDVNIGDVVYDPFMGSGTTNVTAKKSGRSSYGVEAHPFVFRVAHAKLNWDITGNDVLQTIAVIENQVRHHKRLFDQDVSKLLEKEFPELVLKCYETEVLFDLWLIRNSVLSGNFPPGLQDFLCVGLTGLLRQVANVQTGWPYIAPKKPKNGSTKKDTLLEFSRQLLRMANDITTTISEADKNYPNTFHKIFNADARHTAELIPNQSVDHVFTSPPYLNNFDYADRTRLELYFFGEARNWGDITTQIRSRLITSATTQISRDDPRYHLSDDLRHAVPEVFEFLMNAISHLSKLRLTKGGKKSYDHLVSGYFNDMFLTLIDVCRVLKSGKTAVFVLGDSAPYGVHIPTDELIGKIGVGVGFSDYTIDILRSRGGKWKENPQRHNVQLRESIVTLKKR